jgi:hypothetical protein
MESLYLLDGTREKSGVKRVSQAVIDAHKAGIALPWHTAQVIQLAGSNILEAVQIYVRSQAPVVASQTFIVFSSSPQVSAVLIGPALLGRFRISPASAIAAILAATTAAQKWG